MSNKTIPSEVVKDILGGLDDPSLASLRASIEKRLEVKPQESPNDTTNWNDRVLVASASSDDRSFITFYTDKKTVATSTNQ